VTTSDKRLRRFLWPDSLAGKAFAALVLAMVLVVALWLIAWLVMERRLAAAMKRAEVEWGLPNSVSAMLPSFVPPERNAAVPLDEASALVQRLRTKFRGAGTNRTIARKLVDDPLLGAESPERHLDALLDEVDRRPEYSSTLVVTGPWFSMGAYPLIDREDLHAVERHVAEELAEEGRPHDAVRRLVRILRISRRWTALEPHGGNFFQEAHARIQIVRTLNDVLRTARLHPSLYADIDAEMVEQGRVHELLPRVHHFNKLKKLEDFDLVPDRRSAWWLVGPLAANDRLFLVDWYDDLARWSRRPYGEVKEVLQAAGDELRRISKHSVDRLLHPDALNVASSTDRVVYDWLSAVARCLRVVNAMAKQDRWDADLDGLDLPAEAIVDPYGRRPFILQRTPRGPVVYCFGPDGIDDGGTLDREPDKGLDVGLGPPRKQKGGR
jgi:hypothetical protein